MKMRNDGEKCKEKFGKELGEVVEQGLSSRIRWGVATGKQTDRTCRGAFRVKDLMSVRMILIDYRVQLPKGFLSLSLYQHPESAR